MPKKKVEQHRHQYGTATETTLTMSATTPMSDVMPENVAFVVDCDAPCDVGPSAMSRGWPITLTSGPKKCLFAEFKERPGANDIKRFFFVTK